MRGIVPVPKPPIWGYDCFWYDGSHPTLCLGWLTIFWGQHRSKDGLRASCRRDLE